MHDIFLSYSFQNETMPLLQAVRSIIECAGFRVVDGKALAGAYVTAEVAAKIKACSGVVCVITPEADETGWVNAEFFQAVGQGKKRLFVLCKKDIDLPNAFQGIAVSRYTDEEQLISISTLAATLGLWSQSLGTSLRAVLLPEDVGQKAHDQNAKCFYRCMEMNSFSESEWRAASLKPIDAAIHAILPEVPFAHSVQLKIELPDKTWKTTYTPQHLRLQLK